MSGTEPAAQRVPGVTPAEIQRVAAYFAQADADGDGVVGLKEGATFFKLSGLPQSSLKTIWSLVADDAGGGRHQLTQEQFCVAFQLIEFALANGGDQCAITEDLLPAPSTTAPSLVPESPAPFDDFIDGPFSPGPDSLSPARNAHFEEADGVVEQDFFTSVTAEQTSLPMRLCEPQSKRVPNPEPSFDLLEGPTPVMQSSAGDTTDKDPFAPSPRTCMAANSPRIGAYASDLSSLGSSVGPKHSYNSTADHDGTTDDMFAGGFQAKADVSSAQAQFDADSFAFNGGFIASTRAEDVDPFGDDEPIALTSADHADPFGDSVSFEHDPFGNDPAGNDAPFDDDDHTFDGASRAEPEHEPPSVSLSGYRLYPEPEQSFGIPEPEQSRMTTAVAASAAGDTTLNAEAARAAPAPDSVEVRLSRTAEGFGIVIGEDAALSAWTATAGKGAERILQLAGVGLGWRIVKVAGYPVMNRADVIARLGQTIGDAQVSFTFSQTAALNDAMSGTTAPVHADDRSWSTSPPAGERVEASRSLARLVAFETMPHPPPSQSAMTASTDQAASQLKDQSRAVLSFLTSTPKSIAALEREMAILLKEQEAEVEEFLKLRSKFEVEVVKISEDHEKSFERAVRKDQKKGTGRHSADKWTTAAATDVRACEAKYANELRMRADRMLRGRQLVAELYLRGMETIQVRTRHAY
eukprot:COSAG03_NODE_146_length_11610_cov_7.478586_1_plen_694_part_00